MELDILNTKKVLLQTHGFADTWYVGCNNGSFGHVTISDNEVMCTSGVGDTRPKCKNIREWTIQDAANYMCQ